jgi:hypothetical protein
MDYLECYQVLHARPGCSLEQLHGAYRRMVLRYHPDRSPGKSNLEAFYRVNEAYTTLRSGLCRRVPSRAIELRRAWGACPKCGRTVELFNALNGNPACANCLLRPRRRFFPLPTYTTICCLPTITLEALGGLWVVLAACSGDWQQAMAGVASVFVGMISLSFCLHTVDIVV